MSDEYHYAKARLVLSVLTGESCAAAEAILNTAKHMLMEEAGAKLLDSQFRTRTEKELAPVFEPILSQLFEQLK